jgi:CheY-like chemotaxis protein
LVEAPTYFVFLGILESREASFDMAILDMQMPGMDGETLGTRIRADHRYDSMRLVMMTSLGMRGDAARSREIGFDVYLTKPVRSSDLRDTLSLALGQPVAVDAEPEIVTKHTAREARRERFRILVAEDNPINQMVAEGILESLGFKATLVANGLEALHALEAERFDVVLMDCQMPVMSGFDATRAIRAESSRVHDRTIPVIALTANAMDEDRDQCAAAGMDDYLSKPFSPDALEAMLEKWLPQG